MDVGATTSLRTLSWEDFCWLVALPSCSGFVGQVSLQSIRHSRAISSEPHRLQQSQGSPPVCDGLEALNPSDGRSLAGLAIRTRSFVVHLIILSLKVVRKCGGETGSFCAFLAYGRQVTGRITSSVVHRLETSLTQRLSDRGQGCGLAFRTYHY